MPMERQEEWPGVTCASSHFARIWGPSWLALPTLCTNTAHPYLFLCVSGCVVPSCLWFGRSMGKEDERPIFHCEFVAYETLLSVLLLLSRGEPTFK